MLLIVLVDFIISCSNQGDNMQNIVEIMDNYVLWVVFVVCLMV